MKKITVITGHYGSGKSTFAANYAIKSAKDGEKVTVVDMDTVNPYYRTADLADIFEENGVRLAAPMYAGTNLDIPVLDYDLPALTEDGSKLVIDMGGDDAGAYPLGRFGSFLERCGEDNILLLYTVNFRRFLTHDCDDAEEMLREIEAACKIKAGGIVNNTNLGYETDKEIIYGGMEKAERFAARTGLPVFFHTVPKLPSCAGIRGEKLFPVEILIKNAGF